MEKQPRIKTVKSFTLVEILIVVGIIVLLAAITIPNLARQRTNANERRVITMIQSIIVTELDYRSSHPTYCYFKETDPPSLDTDEGLLDATPPYLTIPGYPPGEPGGTLFVDYSNYRILIKGPDANGFEIIAAPLSGAPGRRFWTNEDGVIYYCSTPGCDPWPPELPYTPIGEGVPLEN